MSSNSQTNSLKAPAYLLKEEDIPQIEGVSPQVSEPEDPHEEASTELEQEESPEENMLSGDSDAPVSAGDAILLKESKNVEEKSSEDKCAESLSDDASRELPSEMPQESIEEEAEKSDLLDTERTEDSTLLYKGVVTEEQTRRTRLSREQGNGISTFHLVARHLEAKKRIFNDPKIWDFFGLLLQKNNDLHELLHQKKTLLSCIQHMLLLSIFGFGVYGASIGWLAQYSGSVLLPYAMFWIPFYMVLVSLGATAISLPVLAFFTMYFGLAMDMRFLMAQSVRFISMIAVILVGLVPFYLAVAIACTQVWKVHIPAIDTLVAVGFLLPFGIGLLCFDPVLISFRKIADTMPRAEQPRAHVCTQIIFFWGMLYAAVAPLALLKCIHHTLSFG